VGRASNLVATAPLFRIDAAARGHSFPPEVPIMPKPPERRRPSDPLKAAEALFARPPPRLPDQAAQAPTLPGVKETVTLRIDEDVLEFFREDGPGWQDRINAALRKLVEHGRG
jgi:uncharacterized protein (DUF4415 family)